MKWFHFKSRTTTLGNSIDEFIFAVSAFTSPKRLRTGELVDHEATDHDTIHSFKVAQIGCWLLPPLVYRRVNVLDRCLRTRIQITQPYTMDRQAAWLPAAAATETTTTTTTAAFPHFGRTHRKKHTNANTHTHTIDEKWPSQIAIGRNTSARTNRKQQQQQQHQVLLYDNERSNVKIQHKAIRWPLPSLSLPHHLRHRRRRRRRSSNNNAHRITFKLYLKLLCYISKPKMNK